MLNVVAIPIGNPDDITLRAIESLKAADVVIGEERREVSTLLKRLGIEKSEVHLLNEHSKDEEVLELLELCKEKTVALVSDAGTPGFCDPGARLVSACRKANIKIVPIPGASALMCLIASAGAQIKNFVFAGFPPAEREERAQALKNFASDGRAIVLMDTPYRLEKLLSELAQLAPERNALLGMDFTLESESILENTLKQLAENVRDKKAEFMLLLYPLDQAPAQRKSVVPPNRTGKKRFTPGRRRRP
jgi:16S rRNA (cytidine1402-2'-O)-methyltransferase